MRAMIALPRTSWTGGRDTVLSVTEQRLVGETLPALLNELPKLTSNSVHHTVNGAKHEEVAAITRDVVRAADTGARVIDTRLARLDE